MATEGVDFSSARPAATCLRMGGKAFVARYFGPGGTWKHATRTEIAAYRAAGLAIIVAAEGVADDALRGLTKGAEHARSAHDAMVAAGVGPDTPIYFAVDFDMRADQWSAVKAYLDGCASVIGRDRVGVYGGLRSIQLAAQQHAAAWFWQTYAWSGGFWSAASMIQQYRNGVTVCGGDVDLDRAVVANYGQWPAGPGPAPGAPDPQAPVVTQGAWDYTPNLGRMPVDFTSWAQAADSAARSLDSFRI